MCLFEGGSLMTVFGMGHQSISRPQILAATGLLAMGFALGLGSARWTQPAMYPDEDRNASEMETAVRSAMAETSAFDRSRALTRLFSGLDASNVPGAVQGMWTRSEYLDPIDLQLLLSAWTRFDAAAAMHEARNWPSKEGGEIGMRIVMREWAASGRAIEAADYYQNIEDAEVRSIVAGPLIRGWALSGDFDDALRGLRLLMEQGAPVGTVDGFVRGALNSIGPAELIERVVALERNQGGEFEHRLTRLSLNLGARANPIAASSAYASLEGDQAPGWLLGALPEISSPWADTEPAAAVEWLLERADSPERTVAIKAVLRGWASRDLEAAWSWWSAAANARTEDSDEGRELRGVLLVPLLFRMAEVRPSEAAKWVEEVEPSVLREKLILRVAHYWAYSDQLEAEQWVESLGLSGPLAEKAAEAVARGAEKSARFEEGTHGTPSIPEK